MRITIEEIRENRSFRWDLAKRSQKQASFWWCWKGVGNDQDHEEEKADLRLVESRDADKIRCWKVCEN